MQLDSIKEHRCSAVVIPTYNEAGTICKLIEHLFGTTFPSIDSWDMYIVIVDGNSPDGTAESVRELQSRYNNLHLIVEQGKEGIGAAYFKGFRYAVNTLGVDVLIEFDGDFQHPPEAIPLYCKRLKADQIWFWVQEM